MADLMKGTESLVIGDVMLLGSATNHLCMYEQKNKANRSARPALTLTFTQIHENYMDTFFAKRNTQCRRRRRCTYPGCSRSSNTAPRTWFFFDAETSSISITKRKYHSTQRSRQRKDARTEIVYGWPSAPTKPANRTDRAPEFPGRILVAERTSTKQK